MKNTDLSILTDSLLRKLQEREVRKSVSQPNHDLTLLKAISADWARRKAEGDWNS